MEYHGLALWSLAFVAFAALAQLIWRRRGGPKAANPGLHIGGHDTKSPPSLADDPALQAILPANADTVSRGDWVIRLARYFQTRHAEQYNVLVINAAIDKVLNIDEEDVVETFQTVYASRTKDAAVTYDVHVFRKGTLVNLGDGGYINWCFSGNYDRTGMSVRFSEIQPGQPYQL